MNQKTCAIVAALSSLASLASAGQYNIGFRHYTGYEDPADPLAGLSMCVDANETEGYVDFTFSLDALSGVGTIKSIWFERPLELGDASDITSLGQVDLRLGRGKRNPAGATGELDWDGTEERLSRKGGAANGIDAGESLTVRFEAGEDFFAGGLAALLSGDARVAFHLQRLGANAQESAHFVSSGGTPLLTAVPLPSAGLLAAAGLGVVAGPRRRR